MQFPKLTPLQSRFAASLAASLLLVIIYFSLSPSHFAYAAELDSVLKEDHNHHRLSPDVLEHGVPLSDIDWEEEDKDVAYESDFVGVDRGIIGRAAPGALQEQLANNDPKKANIDAGATNYYVFMNATVFGEHGVRGLGMPSELHARGMPSDREGWTAQDADSLTGNSTNQKKLEKRQSDTQSTRTVYISINTCLQPQPVSDLAGPSPPLTLYVSQSDANQQPGPGHTDPEQQSLVVEDGFAALEVDAMGNVYIGVAAPDLTDAFSGSWNYELAASIDEPYHACNASTPFLYLVDTDINSALLVTDNLTDVNATDDIRQQWMNSELPFTMYVYDQNNRAIQGVEKSFCGLQEAGVLPNVSMGGGMTARGLGGLPKQQFYIEGLNASTTYSTVLAMSGNSTQAGTGVVGGGGKVWAPRTFTTKADGNCQVIFDLPFCSDVAWAVPSNPNTFNRSTLTLQYDNFTQSLYKNFSYSLQQIPCNTTSTAQYSLARNCTDCARDYKNWLCAVTIPRCADFSTPNSTDNTYLKPRNIGAPFISNDSLPDLALHGLNNSLLDRYYAKQSRNPMIDDKIKPGPYKEVLPCDDLCYELVKSCPAALGFACPTNNHGMLERSYGFRGMALDGGPKCSYFGAVYHLEDKTGIAGRSVRDMRWVLGVAVATALLLLM